MRPLVGGALGVTCDDCYDGTPVPWGFGVKEAEREWNEAQASLREEAGDE
jgi:hypothetical protein